MKLLILSLALMATSASASSLKLTSVKQPLYLHGSDMSPTIQISDVPFATAYADPEWRFTAVCKPCIPAADGSHKEPSDVNLTSLYGITTTGTYEGEVVLVVIDASKAAVPGGYPFTIDQVVDAVATCVKLMYPQRPKDDSPLEIKIVPPAKKGAGE